MLDLKTQYYHIKNDIDKAVIECLESTEFINGKSVKIFADNLSRYLNVKNVIPCANGTDALQIALMALNLNEGDEVIIPAFTYVATAEVIALLKLVPVLVDVDPNTFNLTAEGIKPAITAKTKAIVPVHLFGQACNMEKIMELAAEFNLKVIEDNAQAIGAKCRMQKLYPDSYPERDERPETRNLKPETGNEQNSGLTSHLSPLDSQNYVFAGTIGHIGTTSFFPSKNLGCFGDGGAMFTNDDDLAKKLKMIANHGQEVKYYHKVVGCNSRLDTLQATVLNIKLKHLNAYIQNRQRAAAFYDNELKNIEGLEIPERISNSTHVFHQYTLKVKNGKRDPLKQWLSDKGVPSMIYYPLPLNEQEAFKGITRQVGSLHISKTLSNEVLSLPMHTELDEKQLQYITKSIIEFFKNV